MDEYVKCLSAIEKWLYNAGHVDVIPEERKVSEFIHEEKQIFLILGECLNPCPTAREWLSVLFTRLAVLTHHDYYAFLEPAWHRCGAFVTMITMVLDTSHSKCPPSRIACGLFMHSLVAVRLLPFEVLCPCFMESVDWEKLFVDSQPEGLQAALPCLLVTDCMSVFTQQVQVAAGSCLTSLIEDSYYMAAFMREAFPALRAWNYARRFPCDSA